mmetsp:Transcript_40920/g.87157  ORF Transcript_40920/g.87157 Transcript_40920/m.87157 type:complete len:217 (+) Transcript_40920:2128-2778(+)
MTCARFSLSGSAQPSAMTPRHAMPALRWLGSALASLAMHRLTTGSNMYFFGISHASMSSVPCAMPVSVMPLSSAALYPSWSSKSSFQAGLDSKSAPAALPSEVSMRLKMVSTMPVSSAGSRPRCLGLDSAIVATTSAAESLTDISRLESDMQIWAYLTMVAICAEMDWLGLNERSYSTSKVVDTTSSSLRARHASATVSTGCTRGAKVSISASSAR